MKKDSERYIYCPQCKTKLISAVVDNSNVKKCPQCDYIFWNNPKPSVSVIISKDNQVLMLQRNSEPFYNFWVLPVGYLGTDETPEEAAIREAKEETGLTITIDKLIGVYRTDNDPRGIDIDIIFSGLTKDEIHLGNEHAQWKYFSVDNLPKEIAYKHRQAIVDWYNKNKI